MAPFDRSYTTYYWPAIVSIALSFTIFELLDVKSYHYPKSGLSVTQGHKQIAPFESVGMVSYLPSIATLAICLAISEMFSVK